MVIQNGLAWVHSSKAWLRLSFKDTYWMPSTVLALDKRFYVVTSWNSGRTRLILIESGTWRWLTESSPALNILTSAWDLVVISSAANWLAVTKMRVDTIKARNRWLITFRCLRILRCSFNTIATSDSSWKTWVKSCNRSICRWHVRRKSTQTRKKMDVLYSHEHSSKMHAMASLAYAFPRKGIREPPEQNHHILYALSATKQGRTK